ncbi:hypothetical protein KC363_g6227 [Hortaea werneckii]|nr:hypothetical protein KC361_g6979 [Hortaea werneckii]KAI6881221.1 hypothetical protein KC325_g6684 [Hortaea werneckii]KAI6989310.1 hypothetical protein KC359_g7301 [Hortaea werneckii]KAI7142991.1 hypothetical protein KC344_g6705 [Hortaea werneckii]KAI7170497.1 hypothetical protein KC360_g6795 [Hortaea werneckii]
MAIRSREDAPDAARNGRLFSLMTQGSVPKLQAQYYLCRLDPWAVSSQVLGDVDIHTILADNGGGSRAGLQCRAEVLDYHMRHAAERVATFKSDTDFKITGHQDDYSITPLNGGRVFSASCFSKICLVDATVELDDTARVLSGQDPERDEADWLFRKVEWGADRVQGLKDDVDGPIEFQHERSGRKFRGVPRGQLVREGYPTGFVIISSTVEEGRGEEEAARTLAVRDHHLLWLSQNDGRSGEEGDELGTPVIIPLVEDEMDAIFELKLKEEGGGEIEARRMESGGEDNETEASPKPTIPA